MPYHCLSRMLCEKFIDSEELNRPISLRSTPGPKLREWVRPPSARKTFTLKVGTMLRRSSPFTKIHGAMKRSCLIAGPPRAARSSYTVPSWPTVLPTWNPQLFLNVRCVLLFSPASSGSDFIVHICHQLRFV